MEIKMWRSKSRERELIRLSEEQKDFEYRRLFIEEYKEKIEIHKNREHFFSKHAWTLLIVALISFKMPMLSLVIFGFSLLFKTISGISKTLHRRSVEEYNLGLAIVDSVIKKDYGINFN